jgi:NAD(P)-dependent dehydrogenase (short-subunit alcohol dehydrogenase family)
MRELTDKVALVTGGARGIGFAIALEFAIAGAKVVVADLDFTAAESSALEIQRSGGDATPLLLDVTDGEAVQRGVETSIDAGGGLDILVNNAGIHSESPTRSSTINDFHRCMDVNLFGAWRVAQAVAPHFKNKHYGKIINIASVNGRVPWAETPAYSASKAALINLTQALARSLGAFGINVNALCPGGIVTDMARGLFEDTGALESNLAKQRALNRALQPEDIAFAAVFLASDRARNITGQSLNVDGGGIFN